MDTFLTQLLNARAAQTGAISETETESDTTTAVINTAMTGLYKILGQCIAQFPGNPAAIEPIFDLQTIRNIEQTHFTDHIAAGVTQNICQRTLGPAAQVRLKVLTAEPLTFWFAQQSTDAYAGLGVAVPGNTEQVVNASDLGPVPGAKFLKVINRSPLLTAQYEVELL